MLNNMLGDVEIKKPNDDEYDPEEYVHFHVLCALTLGQPIRWDGVGDWVQYNAKVLSQIPEDELKTLTLGQLVDRGISPTCF